MHIQLQTIPEGVSVQGLLDAHHTGSMVNTGALCGFYTILNNIKLVQYIDAEGFG